MGLMSRRTTIITLLMDFVLGPTVGYTVDAATLAQERSAYLEQPWTSVFRWMVEFGVIILKRRQLRFFATVQPILGDMIGTNMANCSLSTPSLATFGIWCLAAISKSRLARARILEFINAWT